MNKLKEKIEGLIICNISSLIIAVFGLIVPGALTVATYKLQYYSILGIFQLLLLSFVISAPSYGYMYLLLVLYTRNDKDCDDNILITVTSIINFIVFMIANVIKIFYPYMNRCWLVSIVIATCLVFTVVIVMSLFFSKQTEEK